MARWMKPYSVIASRRRSNPVLCLRPLDCFASLAMTSYSFLSRSPTGRRECAVVFLRLLVCFGLCAASQRRPFVFVLRHELTLRGRRSRIHVAAAVDVVVDLGGAAEHPAIEEDRERAGFQRLPA